MKKDLERFMFITEYNYDKQNTQQKLYEQFIKPSEINRYSHRFSEMISLSDDDNILSEDNGTTEDVIQKIKNKEFDVNSKDFSSSLKSGNRGEFLSDYTEDEYGKMTTYKLIGYNIGFAIKNDGDIVSVHNNSGAKGIGGILIQSAVSFGGTKLDHFDGFLTGLYDIKNKLI